MNTEPITLSQEHSDRLRALHHVASFMSMEELLHELIFAIDPNNTLHTMLDGLEGAQQRRVNSMFHNVCKDDFENWDALVERANELPVYDPADYPEPVYTPTNIIAFEVIK